MQTREGLRLASIEITRRCDNCCPYCEQPKSDEEMPVTRFAALLDVLRAEGVDAVALGGGEPTLHPELPELLRAAQVRSLPAGLTTNARAPELVAGLADAGLLQSFGVSAGKGKWLALAGHPRAVVNLLLLRDGSADLLQLAAAAVRHGARCLLLLSYKGDRADLEPTTGELAGTFSLLTALGRRARVTVAADECARRTLGLAQTCGEGFVRVNLDGSRQPCCFPACRYRSSVGPSAMPLGSGARPT